MRCLFVLLVLLLSAAPAWSGDRSDRFFELYDLDGHLFSLARVAGEEGVRLVAVDFFWDGCEPCRRALPEWKQLYSRYKEKGLRVVVVDVRASDDLPAARRKLRDYFAANPMPFPVVFDKYNLVARQFGVVTGDGTVTLPQIFLLAPDGKTLLKTGSFEEAARMVQEVLEEARPPH